MLNAFEIDKQRVHFILCNNVKNMKKAKDDLNLVVQQLVSSK